MYEVMGAFVRGKRSNQLLEDERGYTEADRNIPTTKPDVSDPTSDFWSTHIRPKPFNPSDPNLADAPLKPEDMARRNYAYGSAADDYANTGLVEPPKVNYAYGSKADDYAETGLVEPQTKQERISGALQTIGEKAGDIGFKNFVPIVQNALEELKNIAEFPKRELWWKFNNQNEINVDGNVIEMEVLNDKTVGFYGGEPSLFQIGVDTAMHVIDIGLSYDADLNDQGQLWSDMIQGMEADDPIVPKVGDVRITFQLKEHRWQDWKYNFFIRNGNLILITDRENHKLWDIYTTDFGNKH